MTVHTYELSCTDCEFQTTVEANDETVLDLADDHQQEFGNEYLDHFVNFSIVPSRSASTAPVARSGSD